MQFTDRMTLDGALRRTSDGYGVVSARVARGGNVQVYLGSEVGVKDKALVRVYRPADEVFKRDALASYAGVPVTIDHPKDKVTADNWKALSVGEAGDDVLRDGEFVRVPLMLRDAKAIEAVDGGKRELSMGYDAQLTLADGVTPDGEPFDAIMSDFKMNHVALVDRARGGEELRIGDGAVNWGASPVPTADRKDPDMSDTLRNVVVDGLSVSTTDQGAAAIQKLTTDRDEARKAVSDAKVTHDAAIAAKDEEIGKLKADLKTAKDAANIDVSKLVADRVALEGQVKAIDSAIDPKGKSDADLRKATVAAKLGDEMVTDASDAEITGMFKALTKDAKNDTVRDALRAHDGAVSANDAWGDSVFASAGVQQKKGA